MNQAEYNAIIHAIWNIDRMIADNEGNDNEKLLTKLNRDRNALLNLFDRLNQPPKG